MSKVKFIHTSDLHLDTPFKGLNDWNPDLAQKLGDATFKSFKRIIDICINEKVDFLIISGDIFDSEQQSLTAQLRFISEIRKLSAENIPLYFVCGNHDPLISWLDTLHLPANVHRFSADKVEKISFVKNNKVLADIYGISFKEKVVKKNLAALFPLADKNTAVSIAVLHATVGTHREHEVYAPFKKADIENKGYDYWALGHIHKSEIVQKSHPAIVYPGNPQGRDFGEIGEKSCFMVEIESGQAPVFKVLPVNLFRFEEMNIDLSGLENLNELNEKFQKKIKTFETESESTANLFRISFSGRTILHKQLIKEGEAEELRMHFNQELLNNFSNFNYIDRISIDTKPDIDVEQLKKGSDFIAELMNKIDEYHNDDEKSLELFNMADAEITNIQIKKLLNNLTESEKAEILDKSGWILLDLFSPNQ